MSTKNVTFQPFLLPQKPNQIIAAVVWLAATWTTGLFLHSLNIPLLWTVLAALILQAALTALEGYVWKGKGDPVVYVALIFDIILNMSGTWIWVKELPGSTLWIFIIDIFNWSNSANIAEWPLLIPSAVVGLFWAYAPEAIWKVDG